MFACLSLPASAAVAPGVEPDALEMVARAFSPRVEVHAAHFVSLDISGLGRLLGPPADIGRELVREVRQRGCAADVAIAASRTAAMLLALACDGLTVVAPGEEARKLANLPLGVLARLAAVAEAGSRQQAAGSGQQAAGSGQQAAGSRQQAAGSRQQAAGSRQQAAGSGQQAAGSGQRAAGSRQQAAGSRQQAAGSGSKSTNQQINNSTNQQIAKSTPDLPVLALFRRWGLRTLGELAALPRAALSARIGQDGLRWQRVARGEDLEPLIARPPQAPIEEQLDLDWPVEGLEPLSFLLPRLIDPICERLERLDEAAVSLELSFRLATREQEARRIQLPAPMRDAKVLRTLILLHLESHPLGAGVDRLGLRVETAPARIVQFSLLSRALPFPEQMATLVARLGALMGERRVGSPGTVDSYRPGAFAMEGFRVMDKAEGGGRRAGTGPPPPASRLPTPSLVLRRFRRPISARVLDQEGRPVRVTTERRGVEGGRVEASAGPWRTSGEWWKVGPTAGSGQPAAGSREPAAGSREWAAGSQQPTADNGSATPPAASRLLPAVPWNRDEWDVALSDGAIYRIYRDRATDRWFIEGILD